MALNRIFYLAHSGNYNSFTMAGIHCVIHICRFIDMLIIAYHDQFIYRIIFSPHAGAKCEWSKFFIDFKRVYWLLPLDRALGHKLHTIRDNPRLLQCYNGQC